MTLQTQFDTTIKLLKENEEHFSFISDLLNLYQTSTVSFLCFDKPSRGSEKTHLLNIYETRSEMENNRKGDKYVFGYDTLLPNFRKTKHADICISDFSTEIGSFIILSDFNKKDLIGVLFSKTTLPLQSLKMNKYLVVAKASDNELSDFIQNENIFVNGLLKISDSTG